MARRKIDEATREKIASEWKAFKRRYFEDQRDKCIEDQNKLDIAIAHAWHVEAKKISRWEFIKTVNSPTGRFRLEELWERGSKVVRAMFPSKEALDGALALEKTSIRNAIRAVQLDTSLFRHNLNRDGMRFFYHYALSRRYWKILKQIEADGGAYTPSITKLQADRQRASDPEWQMNWDYRSAARVKKQGKLAAILLLKQSHRLQIPIGKESLKELRALILDEGKPMRAGRRPVDTHREKALVRELTLQFNYSDTRSQKITALLLGIPLSTLRSRVRGMRRPEGPISSYHGVRFYGANHSFRPPRINGTSYILTRPEIRQYVESLLPLIKGG